jgi:hypothetical protein
LSRCAWESLKVFLQEAVPEKNPVPGAVIAVQTFGDLIGHNPHCHILVTDGYFLRQAQDDVYDNKGMFRVASPLLFDTKYPLTSKKSSSISLPLESIDLSNQLSRS